MSYSVKFTTTLSPLELEETIKFLEQALKGSALGLIKRERGQVANVDRLNAQALLDDLKESFSTHRSSKRKLKLKLKS